MSNDDNTRNNEQELQPILSRRHFLAGSVASAAVLGASGCSLPAGVLPGKKAYCGTSRVSFKAPFKTFREYVTALEQHGLLIRFPRLDQDKYEMTAVMYRLIEEWGWKKRRQSW